MKDPLIHANPKLFLIKIEDRDTDPPTGYDVISFNMEQEFKYTMEEKYGWDPWNYFIRWLHEVRRMGYIRLDRFDCYAHITYEFLAYKNEGDGEAAYNTLIKTSPGFKDATHNQKYEKSNTTNFKDQQRWARDYLFEIIKEDA